MRSGSKHCALTSGRAELERSEFALRLVDDLDGAVIVVMDVDRVHNGMLPTLPVGHPLRSLIPPASIVR